MASLSERSATISFAPDTASRDGKWQAVVIIYWLGRSDIETTDYVFDTEREALEYAKGYCSLRAQHARDMVKQLEDNLNGNRA